MKLKRAALLFFIFSVLLSSHCLVLGSSVADPAPQPVALKITEEVISQSYTGLQISGIIPVIEITRKEIGSEIGSEAGLNTNVEADAEDFSKEVNRAIRNLYDEKTQEAQRGRVSLLSFDYELKEEDDMASLLIKTAYTRGAIKNEIDSVNFHMENGRFLTISDVLGPNGVNISNKVISEEIKKNPEKYNPIYNDINNGHSFYVENGTVFILFSENEIAAGSHGVLEFPIKIDAVTDYALPKASYYQTGSYGLKMIPVRKVCEAFGYEVKWNDSLRTVELIKDRSTTSFSIGVNEYHQGNVSRALEAAPEIRDGMTHVPVSFFGDILDLVHSVDANGTATFTMYEQK